MKIYKVCYDCKTGFNVYTYDFWSYVFGRKPEGLLFFNAQKANKYADELNILYREATNIVNEKYKTIRESYFSD